MGVTGASAQQLAVRALQLLLNAGEPVELVASRGCANVWRDEQGLVLPRCPDAQEAFWRQQCGCQDGELRCHAWNALGATIASGSYPVRGMLILPCTMGTVARLATGVSLELLERAADVQLKERRPLVIAPREMPWTLIHLRNLTRLAEAGAHIAPPIPAWYQRPESLEDMVDFLVIRILDNLGYDLGQHLRRWQGPGSLAVGTGS
ncbi:MAG: amino acid decarboxylase [Candidatus Synechococcus spongiarum 142]|uniref:Amino acid decarboxylase n=1 Tax=Candidatus Synechococcus spongiarum 142 TaxID=1608213 RepID=A0A6N3X4A9_9SYNE|nr:MAG: amino acid decarboxylase [Candidatus Synechococcus spongiarum 142]